jgi:hypothetical protein
MRKSMQRLWRAAACLCLAAGLGTAFFRWGVAVSLIATIALSMLSWVVLTVISKEDPRTWSVAQMSMAVVWGSSALAIISGLSALHELAGILLVTLVLTSPGLWPRLRRGWARARLRGAPPQGTLPPRSRQPDSPPPAIPHQRGPSDARAGDAQPECRVDPAILDDDALCLAWRTSFVRLQSAGSAREFGRLVELRREILDELTRRHDAGVARWLASGARAASNPRRFLDPASIPPGQRP